jgi:hypothetical protein
MFVQVSLQEKAIPNVLLSAVGLNKDTVNQRDLIARCRGKLTDPSTPTDSKVQWHTFLESLTDYVQDWPAVMTDQDYLRQKAETMHLADDLQEIERKLVKEEARRSVLQEELQRVATGIDRLTKQQSERQEHLSSRPGILKVDHLVEQIEDTYKATSNAFRQMRARRDCDTLELKELMSKGWSGEGRHELIKVCTDQELSSKSQISIVISGYLCAHDIL